MSITVNLSELQFSTNSATIEAYRRSVEIRGFSLQRNGNSASKSLEPFIWEKDLDNGSVETERATFDHDAGLLTYVHTGE